jgi:CYTH domain-containing protein
VPPEGKYSRIERERRFLLAAPPPPDAVVVTRQIIDRYLTGTRVRLRCIDDREYKLTQKVPAGEPGPVQGTITTMYLSRPEYDTFAALPATTLAKTRLTVPPWVVDVFGPPLEGLVLGEAEFDTDEGAHAFRPPVDAVAEVTDDARFTGGALARTDRAGLCALLSGYGLG